MVPHKLKCGNFPKVERNEADLGNTWLKPNYEEVNNVSFPPSIVYGHYHLWTRYPTEITKIWNIANLFSPTSWIWSFVSIISIVACLKISTFVGTKYGLQTCGYEIVLCPLR